MTNLHNKSNRETQAGGGGQGTQLNENSESAFD